MYPRATGRKDAAEVTRVGLVVAKQAAPDVGERAAGLPHEEIRGRVVPLPATVVRAIDLPAGANEYLVPAAAGRGVGKGPRRNPTGSDAGAANPACRLARSSNGSVPGAP